MSCLKLVTYGDNDALNRLSILFNRKSLLYEAVVDSNAQFKIVCIFLINIASLFILSNRLSSYSDCFSFNSVVVCWL